MSEENQGCDSTPGTISWNELITPNKAASIKFYADLFGWSTDDMELPDGTIYTMFKMGDRPVGGCFESSEGTETPPIWLSYTNVEDLDASIAKAKKIGGTIVKERVDLPMGSFAVIADPCGAVFAFWKPNGSCPSQS